MRKRMVNLCSVLNMFSETQEFLLLFLIKDSEERQKQVLIGQHLTTKGVGKKGCLPIRQAAMFTFSQEERNLKKKKGLSQCSSETAFSKGSLPYVEQNILYQDSNKAVEQKCSCFCDSRYGVDIAMLMKTRFSSDKQIVKQELATLEFGNFCVQLYDRAFISDLQILPTDTAHVISSQLLPSAPHILSDNCPYTRNLILRNVCENLDKLLRHCLYWTMTGLMMLRNPQSVHILSAQFLTTKLLKVTFRTVE